ncbi:MAG: hypothetical protein ACK559_02030, partial [bacterium]
MAYIWSVSSGVTEQKQVVGEWSECRIEGVQVLKIEINKIEGNCDNSGHWVQCSTYFYNINTVVVVTVTTTNTNNNGK